MLGLRVGVFYAPRISLYAKELVRSLSTVRLSKRMSELDICSRREADRWIRDGLVAVNGVTAVLGQKVENDLTAVSIEVLSGNTGALGGNQPTKSPTTTAVVLHKPPGYVSGQAEHGHPPAAKLLTRDRLWDWSSGEIILPNNSWKGFAPAGRLDLDSTGLLVFSHSGVISKKLISHKSLVEKEYEVEVVPANQVSRRERSLDTTFQLPQPTLDLSRLTDGGQHLLGDAKLLKPCQASWLDKGKRIKIVLTEGRKRHIRRALRELQGFHVVSLERTRIGPIEMGDLPEGCWRPLKQTEIDQIMST